MGKVPHFVISARRDPGAAWNSGSRPGRCRVDREARQAAGESPGSGHWNRAVGQVLEMIDAQLELGLPKRWIVRFETRVRRESTTRRLTPNSQVAAFVAVGSVSWSLLLVSTCVWVLGPSVAVCAQESRTVASPRLIPPSAAGTVKLASRFGGLVTRNTEVGEFEQRELSALNLLGIRNAKGQGVKRNPALARRLFPRSAIQGYTPAMANLGTLYAIGAGCEYDRRGQSPAGATIGSVYRRSWMSGAESHPHFE